MDWASSTPAPTASSVSKAPITEPAAKGWISSRPPVAAATCLQKSSKALWVVSAALHIVCARHRTLVWAVEIIGTASADPAAATVMKRRREPLLFMLVSLGCVAAEP